MSVKLESEYLVGLVGLIVGGGIGLAIGAMRAKAIGVWDARVSIPLLLAACGAHIALIPVIESQLRVAFVLYGIALIGVVALAAAGVGIWRLGGVFFPAGSIAAYFYFAFPEHQVDYVGLLVKVVELAAIVAVVAPVLKARSEGRGRRVAF